MRSDNFGFTCVENLGGDYDTGGSLKEALSSERFIPDWAATGREGLQRALTHNPHLIILDLRLPDGSGFDVCRQMRQMDLCQPSLILTARSEEVDKVVGLEMGADDYLTKPFGMREKIEPDPSRPSLILTVPGIGYRLHQPKFPTVFQN